MGMGFTPTWLRQVSPPASHEHDHFNHCSELSETSTYCSGRWYGRTFPAVAARIWRVPLARHLIIVVLSSGVDL